MRRPANQPGPQGFMERRLARASSPVLVGYAICAAFGTYFCMYAFRKPFSAAEFEGNSLGPLDLKTTFVISQIIGYGLSKYLGIKICSEMPRARRALALVVLVMLAELALLLFAVAPPQWRIVAMFLNGLPLGMVWGLVVWYLEGRRTSEILLAGLSCSFIVSSASVKDVGKKVMDAGVAEAWMPFVVGLIFLGPYLLFVWLLNQMPPPSAADEAARTPRRPMHAADRWRFLKRYAAGMGLLLVCYFFLTAFRDFRDNYAIEIFARLGYAEEPLIFTRTELPVAVGVMLVLAMLNIFRNNVLGLVAAFGVMTFGTVLIGVGTFALDAGWIDGLWWMILMGLGGYLTYVPFGSLLFDRLIAATRSVGTAVFAIYVADALGYTGSVGLQLYKDLSHSDMSRFEFFRGYCYAMAVLGTFCLVAACAYFVRKSVTATEAELAPEPGAVV